MKKIFAIALAVVMVLSIASVASAFTWAKPAEQNADTFASRYQIDVVKLVNQTGILGTNSMSADDNATAVNNAPLYFYIKLTVSGADTANPDDIQQNAEVDVSFTSMNNADGTAFPAVSGYDISGLGNGTYYFDIDAATNGNGWFVPLTNTVINNSVFAKAVIEGRCLDTDTAKVEAKVYSERPFNGWFQVGSYWVNVDTNANTIQFAMDDAANGNPRIVTFTRNADGLITNVVYGAAGDNETMKLYEWLNNGSATEFRKAVENDEVYMTNANLRAAFGYSYSQSDSITWKANSTPIILDPIGIPKTGDNASVIGFAMIMVAVVAAAVAVRKVNA